MLIASTRLWLRSIQLNIWQRRAELNLKQFRFDSIRSTSTTSVRWETSMARNQHCLCMYLLIRDLYAHKHRFDSIHPTWSTTFHFVWPLTHFTIPTKLVFVRRNLRSAYLLLANRSSFKLLSYFRYSDLMTYIRQTRQSTTIFCTLSEISAWNDYV